jgi:hypothetical protein
VLIRHALKVLSGQFEEENLSLFHRILKSSYFCFNGQFYRQTDEVAIDSPLSPVSSVVLSTSPTTGFYVADSFMIWPHGSERMKDFLDWDDSIHHSSRFMMDIEMTRHLPLLGTDI